MIPNLKVSLVVTSKENIHAVLLSKYNTVTIVYFSIQIKIESDVRLELTPINKIRNFQQ